MQYSIRLEVPQQFHQEPIISRLVADYQLVVNIQAAVLGKNGVGGGWFDLKLEGECDRIEAALQFLKQSGLKIWNQQETTQDVFEPQET
jgi:ABC-type methionine transport system ATPase subunit